MFTFSNDPLELISRAVIIYFAIFALLRILGKKHVGELAPFDLVVLLLLSESVSSSLNASEMSVTGGILSAGVLFGVNQFVGYVSAGNRKMERVLEGKPRILVRNGRVYEDVLVKEQVTRSELLEALRHEGCSSLSSVRFAVLENDGSITVGLRCGLSKK